VRSFSDREGIPSEKTYVRSLVADSHGNIWAGFFATGVARLDVDSISEGSFHLFPPSKELVDQEIASIREDDHGRVWIASESNGLILLDSVKLAIRSIRDGLPSNIVTSVTEDSAGRLWVGTGVGVAYLDSARSKVPHKKRDLADSFVFCSGTTKRGLLWFVSQSGLVVYNPLNDKRNESIPSPLITNLRVNEVDRACSGGLNLSYDENNIEIGFVALTFQDQRDVRYQYRMSGIDPDWRPSSAIREITYAALPPGDYTFEVRAFDARGVPSAKTTPLHFSIVPPFWRTWWFTALFWMTVAVTVGGTIRFVEIRKTRKRLRELEYQQVRDRERLRISRDMHDEVGASLTEIAILSELARRSAEKSLETNVHLQKISDKSRAVIDSISEIIWAINPKNDPLENLVAYLHRYAVDYFKSSSIECRFEIPELLPPIQLTSESRRNVFLVVKEALHNVLKHSEAAEVMIRLIVGDQSLIITIEDDGKGFSPGMGNGDGMGLQNMKKRAKDIGGGLEYESNPPSSGMRVRLNVPL
jgi:signal transduction histidine kinase